MKKIILATALLLSVSGTNAFACSEYALNIAEQAENRVMELAKVGITTNTDLLIAERDVLDKKLCMALQDKSIYDDTSLLRQLGKNVDTRIKNENTRDKVGLGEPALLALLKGEKASYLATCQSILKTSDVRIEVGLISQKQYDAIALTCEALE